MVASSFGTAEKRVLLASLVGDGLNSVGSSLWIQVGSAPGDWLEVVIQLIDQRNAGRDVQTSNVFIADAIQMLDQRTQRVAVGGDHHGLACRQISLDVVLPVRKHAVQYILEALGAWSGIAQRCIALIVDLAEFRGIIQCWWRG